MGAIEPLRAAVDGYRAAGDADREWFARIFIADALVFTSGWDEVGAVAEGWEDASGPIASAAAMAVAWYELVSLAALGRFDEAAALRTRLTADPAAAAQFTFLDSVAQSGVELAGGASRAALARLHAAIAELELNDPFGRLPYALGSALIMLRDMGEREAALAWLDRCEREAERVGLGWAVLDFRLQRASLLAQSGDLSRAEVELARAGKRSGGGWREVYEAEAEAHVAMLRGDGATAAAAAQRAFKSIEGGPFAWGVVATVELAGRTRGRRIARRRAQRDRGHAGRPRRAHARAARAPPPRLAAGRARLPRAQDRRAGGRPREHGHVAGARPATRPG